MFHKPIDEIFPNPPEGLERALLDETRIPKHVAVIMDGNGRWAKKRALNRLKGHKAGIEAVRETIRAASDSGVEFLTIYSFSTENWKRPDEEVEGLMNLFAKTMLAEVDGLHEEHVRVMTIGDISRLPKETRDAFDDAWNKTKDTFALMVGHGKSLDGRWDSGCVYGKYTEADLMFKIVKYAVKWLRKSGVSVLTDADKGNNHHICHNGIIPLIYEKRSVYLPW